MQDVLICRNINKTYQDGSNATPVLHDVSLSIKAGEHVAILGSSGSGKSTLLHILGGLDKPSSGEVEFNGKSLGQLSGNALAKLRNDEMGFIYQFHHLLGEFTALENVAMPLRIRGLSTKLAHGKAREMLDEVGLSHRVDHLPSTMSGGERQRVAIARALVTEPSVVLADEPTGNLDSTTGKEILNLFLELNQEGVTLILVTHEQEIAQQAKRIMQMRDGKIIADRIKGVVSC